MNPMGINGPTSPPPYVQPDFRIPAANPAVASYPAGANPLNISALSPYVQPDPLPPSHPFSIDFPLTDRSGNPGNPLGM